MKATLITIHAVFLVLNLAVIGVDSPALLVNGAALVVGTAVLVGLLLERKKPETTEDEAREWMG